MSKRMSVVEAAEKYVAALELEEESIVEWEDAQMDEEMPLVKRLCVEAKMLNAKANVPARRAALVMSVVEMREEKEN